MDSLGRSELLLTKVQQGNWSEVHDELLIHLQSLMSKSLRTCADFVLKFLHTTAKNLSENLEDGNQKLFDSIFTCCKTAITAKTNIAINEDLLIKSLYYIMDGYLKVDYQRALKLSSILYNELFDCKDCKERLSKNMSKSSVAAVYRNLYLIFWNKAASIERDSSQSNIPLDSLLLRLEALKYNYWITTDVVKFFDQTNKAIRVYCQKIKRAQCPNLDTVCDQLFVLMCHLLEDDVSSDATINNVEVFQGSFGFLISWVSHLLNMDLALKAEDVVKKFKLKILKFLKTKLPHNSRGMEYCVDLVLLAVLFHPCVLAEGCSDKNSRRATLLDRCCRFSQLSLDMNDCLSRCFTILLEQFIRLSSWVMNESSNVMQLHLLIPNLSKLLEHFVTAEVQRSNEKSIGLPSSQHEYKFYNYCSFYTHLLTISAASLGRYSKLDSVQSGTVSIILSDAMDVSKRYRELLNKSQDRASSLKYYVSSLWSLAAICYSKEWHTEVYKILHPCVGIWKELLQMKDPSLQKDKLNMLNKIKILALSLTKIALHKDALEVVAEFLLIESLDSNELLEMWVKVKLDANSSVVRKITVLDVLSRDIPETENHKLVKLLKQECAICRRFGRAATAEMCTVLRQMLDLKMDAEDRGESLLEYAELLLYKEHESERTPLNSCQEAIKVLESIHEKKRNKSSKVNYLLAHAYFILHVLETQANQAASTHVLESDATNVLQKDESEEGDAKEKCQTTPTYSHITLEIEYKSMQYLDKALNLWTTVSTNLRDIKDASSALSDLKAMADMYAVSRMISQEIRARKLCLEIAKFSNNVLEWGYSVTRLVHVFCVIGLSNEASLLLSDFNQHSKSESTSSITPSKKATLDVALSLADSELLLMQGKVIEGWQCLQDAFHKFNSLKGRTCMLMYIEAKLLASKFCELPATVLPRDLTADVESPITLAIYSLQSCMVEVKSVLNASENQTLAMDYKSRLMCLLLDSALRVGQLFHDIGAPREARCYLQEKLIWAQKLALANRTAELLLILARVDVLCNGHSECLTKLAGVKYIIESAGKKLSLPNSENLKSEESSAFSDTEVIHSDDDCVMITPAYSVKPFAHRSSSSPPMSPTFSCKASFNYWQNHPDNCSCIKCKHVMFYQLRLELAFLQIECDYLVNNSWESVKDSFTTLLKYANMWRDVAESLFQTKFTARKGRPKTSSRKIDQSLPLLHFDVLICRIFCKMAYMQMQQNCLKEAHETIKTAYLKIKSLPWIGLGYSHYLKSLVIYFYSMAKLLLMIKAEGMSFGDLLDKIWSMQKTSHVELECTEIDFLTAKVDNIVISDKMVDSFKTPKINKGKAVRGRTGSQSTKVSSSGVCDSQASSLDIPTTCHAPVKKYSSLSAYETKFSESELVESNINHCHKRGRKKKVSENAMDDSIQVLDVISSDTVINNENLPQNCKVTRRDLQGDSVLKELTSKCQNEEYKKNNAIQPPSVKSKKTGRTSSTSSNRQRTTRQESKKNVELARADDNPEMISETDLMFSLQTAEFRVEANDLVEDVYVNSTRKSKRTRTGLKLGADTKELHDLNESVIEIEMFRSESSPEVHFLGQSTRNNNSTRGNCFNKAIPLHKIIGLLEKALSLICHHPHMPLYSDLNVFLALLKGDGNPNVICHLFESVAGTIRHIGNMVLEGKLKTFKNDCLSAEVLKLNERKSLLAFNHDPKKMEQLNSLSDKIHKDWTVCQINTVPSLVNEDLSNKNPDLIVTRFQPFCKPVTIRISSDAPAGVETFIDEFNNIQTELRTNVRITVANKWWEIRSSLDNRLKNLLSSIESNWLRHWKGLFLGRPVHIDDEQKLTQVTTKVIEYLGTLGFTDVDKDLLKAVIDSIPWLQASHLRRALAAILQLPFRDPKLGEIAMAVQCHSKYICSDMISRHPVILILDKKIQHLPWESIPILRSNPVTRMPSIHFLLGHLVLYRREDVLFDTSQAFYVLNPSNNLPDTEKAFKDYFNGLKWPGLTGKIPTKEEWTQSLSAKDLFVYCGHGTGNQFINSDIVQRNECRSCTLLMGCSSGKLKIRGHLLEPDGVPLQYLVAGCPSFVGNLWDVTDKDIDRYLMALLKRWLPGPSHADPHLCNNVAFAREACKFTFLVGAAPVVYGLPSQAKIVTSRR